MVRLHHLAVACRSIEAARAPWELALGTTAGPVTDVPEEGVRIAFLKAGASKVELIEPLSPESPIAGFLDKRGEGLHHVAFAVDDIDAALERLKREGVRLLDETPRARGGNRSIIFIHPKDSSGVLIELMETPKEKHGGAHA